MEVTLKKQLFTILSLLCFFNTACTEDQQPEHSFKNKINNAIQEVKNKPLSELINDTTIIAAGITAGLQTYGFLAAYATFKSPYINGAIHYSSFQAAYITYLATIKSLKHAQKLTKKKNEEKQEDDEYNEKNKNKSLIYDEERYPLNLF